MTNEVYRSANGKTVDMGALRLQNERVRAVGNMRVNARGDVIDDNNEVIRTRNEQVNKQYQKQTRQSLPSSRNKDSQ
jgi:glycine cleavage system H lipoate-binding protein